MATMLPQVGWGPQLQQTPAEPLDASSLVPFVQCTCGRLCNCAAAKTPLYSSPWHHDTFQACTPWAQYSAAAVLLQSVFLLIVAIHDAFA